MAACVEKSWLVKSSSVYKFSDVRACLLGYKMSLHDMALTLENLFYGESDIYAFSEISKNSTASKEQNRCGLHIHDVQVDLRAQLRAMYEEVVVPAAAQVGVARAKGAAELAQMMGNETAVSTFEFHCRLRDIFSPLMDGHTMYYWISWVFFGIPVSFSIQKDAVSGERMLFAAPAPESAKLAQLEGHSRLLSAAEPRRVQKINGVDPFAFIQKLADQGGIYADAGSRLNAMLLRGAQSGGFHDGLWSVLGFDAGFPALGEAEVTLTFEDGEETVDSIALFSQSDMEDYIYGITLDYADFVKMETTRSTQEQQRQEEYKNVSGNRVAARVAQPATAKGSPSAGVGDAAGAKAESPRLAKPSLSVAASRAYERLLPGHPAPLLRDAAKLATQRALKAKARPGQKLPRSAAAVAAAHGRGSQAAGADPLNIVHRLQDEGATAAAAESPTASSSPGSEAPGLAALANPETCVADASPLLATEKAHIVYVGKTGDDELVTVTRLEGGSGAPGGPTMIFKLTSFGMQIEDLSTTILAWQEAVKEAKNHNVTRIIFDIISNGGGLVALSDLMQGLVTKDFDFKTLCNWYNKYMNEYWRQWVLSFGQGLDFAVEQTILRLENVAAEQPLEVVRWYGRWELKDLLVILETSNLVLGRAYDCDGLETSGCERVMVDLDPIHQVQKGVEAAETKEQLLDIMRAMLRGKAFIPKVLFGTTHPGRREGDVTNVSGWFPFLGNELLDPQTGLPFQPPMSGLINVQAEEWGGTTSNYSKRGFFETCPWFSGGMESMKMLKEYGWLDPRLDLAIVRDHPFEDIALLTDGCAGSAASAFPSRLMMSGKVTLFSYGGDGAPMDTSSFAGGNVLSYDTWWPQVAFAAELGMWLLPDTPWERMSREVHHEGIHREGGGGSPVYPRPMPTTASARFNFNIMYLKELAAADAGRTELPRQFYRMPAHKHYDVWPSAIESTCGNPKDLYSLYRTVRAEDWCSVRINPQYKDAGWSSACVPAKEECACCDIREFFLDDGAGMCETDKLGWPCLLGCNHARGPVECDYDSGFCACQDDTCARDGMCVDLEKEGNVCPQKATGHGCLLPWSRCPAHSVCVPPEYSCYCSPGYCAVDGHCVEATDLAEGAGSVQEGASKAVVKLSSMSSNGFLAVEIIVAVAALWVFRISFRAIRRVTFGREPLLRDIEGEPH